MIRECRICGKGTSRCDRCSYLLKNGADEGTIRKMLSDTKTSKIWTENKEIANKLAYAYYDSLIETYGKQKKDSRENFGFNTFADGINLGLDVILPLLDAEHLKKVKGKIEMMLKKREK